MACQHWHTESIHFFHFFFFFFFFFFKKKLKKSKVAKNYVLVQGRPTHTPGGGGRLDILWCVLRSALKQHFRVNPFFIFFHKKIKKIKSCEKLCTGSGQAYPHSRGWGGLTSSGVSSDQHLSEATFRVNPFFFIFFHKKN